jgi:hypothetical protein
VWGVGGCRRQEGCRIATSGTRSSQKQSKTQRETCNYRPTNSQRVQPSMQTGATNIRSDCIELNSQNSPFNLAADLRTHCHAVVSGSVVNRRENVGVEVKFYSCKLN